MLIRRRSDVASLVDQGSAGGSELSVTNQGAIEDGGFPVSHPIASLYSLITTIFSLFPHTGKTNIFRPLINKIRRSKWADHA
jgi:hypothetical protein